jgi:hypothetical protein
MSAEDPPGDEPEEIDEEMLLEEIEEMHVGARDLLAADVLMTSEPSFGRDAVAELLGFLRWTANTVAMLALWLQRGGGNPETSKTVAAQMELVAETIRELAPINVDDEEEDDK